LIDIFIGRNPHDLRELADGLTKIKQSISRICNNAKSAELQTALSIVAELQRPDNSLPIDTALVHRDVEALVSTLNASFPRSSDIFNIVLRRSDAHIQQMSVHYGIVTKQPLDKAIRTNLSISPMTNKIAVHAVRTACNITYRDAMQLKDALGHNSFAGGISKKKLVIRLCRMHKFKQHFMQIKAEYCGVTGKNFAEKMSKAYSGVFGELLTEMASV
jgi:hypothetical protein